jgi:hypothetical protein
MSSEFIPELGRELHGRKLDIWHGRASGLSEEIQERYRQNWLGISSPEKEIEFVTVTPWPTPTITPTSSRLVITVAVGEQSQKELAYTGPRISAYARRCGADFVAIAEGSSQAWPMAEKWRVSDYARQYDRTLYLDADVWIADNSPDIFEAHRDGLWMANDLQYLSSDLGWAEFELKKLCESQGIEPPFNWQVMHNSGVWIGDREAFDLYRPPEKPFPAFHCAEQFWQQVCYERAGKEVNELGPRWNWEYIGPKFWEGIINAYFIHLNGVRPIEFRNKLLSRFHRGDFSKIFPPAPRPSDSFEQRWRPSWWRNPRVTPCDYLGDQLTQEELTRKSLPILPTYYHCDKLGTDVRTCQECRDCESYEAS